VDHEIDSLGALRRNWIVIIVLLAVTLIVTAIVTARQTPVYETAAQLVVAPSDATTDPADLVRALETLERRTVVATFARLAATDESRTAVAQSLKLDAKRARAFRTQGSVVPNTNIIRIDTRGPDPKLAAAIANATAARTATEAAALYRLYSLRFLARATAPGGPAYPDRRRNFLVGAAVGLFLGVATALARERLR
jgi:capsular polysaccharide biosynthesis protein